MQDLRRILFSAEITAVPDAFFVPRVFGPRSALMQADTKHNRLTQGYKYKISVNLAGVAGALAFNIPLEVEQRS